MKHRIRQITIGEMPALMVQLKAFEQCSCFVTVDMAYGAMSCLRYMQDGSGAVFGLFDRNGEIIGGLGCIKGPELSSGIMVAVETFWFVTPGKRGNGLALVDAFEQWARDNGCVKAAMIHLVDSHPESLKRFYEMSGYVPVEVHYVKQL
jgi:GNAT superfamily N-acetyltransferase